MNNLIKYDTIKINEDNNYILNKELFEEINDINTNNKDENVNKNIINNDKNKINNESLNINNNDSNKDLNKSNTDLNLGNFAIKIDGANKLFKFEDKKVIDKIDYMKEKNNNKIKSYSYNDLDLRNFQIMYDGVNNSFSNNLDIDIIKDNDDIKTEIIEPQNKDKIISDINKENPNSKKSNIIITLHIKIDMLDKTLVNINKLLQSISDNLINKNSDDNITEIKLSDDNSESSLSIKENNSNNNCKEELNKKSNSNDDIKNQCLLRKK